MNHPLLLDNPSSALEDLKLPKRSLALSVLTSAAFTISSETFSQDECQLDNGRDKAEGVLAVENQGVF